MPELPEVEVTARALRSKLKGARILSVEAGKEKLRVPIPEQLDEALIGHRFADIHRRGKYLIFTTSEKGVELVIHLGMSGTLRVITSDAGPEKHDHLILGLTGSQEMRFNDPRRFGMIALQPPGEPIDPLLRMGPEPLSDRFNPSYCLENSLGRKVAIKNLLLDQHFVAGIGNIYAAEALFEAGIHPLQNASSLEASAWKALIESLKEVLEKSIAMGGTTLKDFYNPERLPGYFATELKVYGREGEYCPRCKNILESMTIANRAQVICSKCQPLKKAV